ncbi:extracellular calcium-sensing receptor-like [Orbicella faveolata]|uniref:extracellular calcium-sensing receptor-like n=1 Tax=Orbicella faveolata TaxID=48498 RepID=UPI0009E512CB|nr:extracellular calcium-sensing receptor-like [Orbicella faveolata]
MQNYKPFFIYWLALYALVQAPYREGDVILGGEVPVHLPGTSEGECSELFTSGLARTLAIIYAIEKINNDSTLLPNITLGYDIRDYCESLPRATQITFDFVQNNCNTNVTKSDMKKKKSIVAVIGPTESRTAIVVAGILQTLNASGVSPSATSAELRSHDYKHLFRMAPSDSFRAKAMADLVEHFNWTYVAAVGQDDSFGRSGLWSIVKEAAVRNNSFCVAFTEFIPGESQLSSIRNIVTKLGRHENIRVVILWLYGSYEKYFLSEVIRQNLTERVWILSDAFTSLAQPGTSTLVGSIGIQPHNFYDTRFEGHRKGLTMTALQQYFPEWWGEIRSQIKNCSSSKGDEMKMDPCLRDFVQNLRISYTPYVIDAVYSVAHALAILAQDFNITTGDDYLMKLGSDVNVMQRLLSRVNFVGLTGNITFNELGGRGTAFYDIVNIQQVQEANTKRLKEVVVGKWEESAEQDKRLQFSEKIRWNTLTGGPPKSECVDKCLAGTRKSITSPCCWQCVSCPRGTINPIPGSESCTECPAGKQSNVARTECSDLPVANLKFSSPGGIVILVFTALGIIVTLLSFAVTCKFWNTPIVKASNREFSLVLLMSILLLLILVLINLFEPTDTICKIIYPWRYITYSLCLSFLLVKIMRISSAFQVPLTQCFVIHSLTNRMQGVIIITMHILLLFVLLSWLSY